MTPVFLHDHKDFPGLLRIIADQDGIEPVLVEKDYWIMHVLWGLQQQEFQFALKGGTSLSKGHQLIDRFSEDIDLLIYPPVSETLGFEVHQEGTKPKHKASRLRFYEWLRDAIAIPGIERIARDTAFDDIQQYRSGGIRLFYRTHFGSLGGVKDGILLEAGFSKVAPNTGKMISSWAYEKASQSAGLALIDNRATDVLCYHPGYTLVEKIQTIIHNYRRELTDGSRRRNFMRQYYDVARILDAPAVQAFIDTKEYLDHKKAWIKNKDAETPVNQHPAFLLQNAALIADYTARYISTRTLYYRGQISFNEIIGRIHRDLHRL